MVVVQCRPHGLLVTGITLAALGFALLIAATMDSTAAPALAELAVSPVAEEVPVRPAAVVRAVRRPGRWRRPNSVAVRSEPAPSGFGRVPASLRPAVVALSGEQAMFMPARWYGESGPGVMGPRLARPPDEIREEVGNAQRWRRRLAPGTVMHRDPPLPTSDPKVESAGQMWPPRPMDRADREGRGAERGPRQAPNSEGEDRLRIVHHVCVGR